MTGGIGWDEKVRVSALRAACASTYEDPYDPVMVRVNDLLDYSSFTEFDGRMTERILARAEVFERWLTRGAPDEREGTLDGVDLEILRRGVSPQTKSEWAEDDGV